VRGARPGAPPSPPLPPPLLLLASLWLLRLLESCSSSGRREGEVLDLRLPPRRPQGDASLLRLLPPVASLDGLRLLLVAADPASGCDRSSDLAASCCRLGFCCVILISCSLLSCRLLCLSRLWCLSVPLAVECAT
jgi:hypothetical protein